MNLIAAIDHLKELQPGWDSYDGAPVDLATREHAKTFVAKASRVLGNAFWAPKIGPTADGGVTLLWRKPGVPTKVEVRFSPSGDSYVIFQRRTVLAKGPIAGFDFDSIRKYVVA
jgi:hypothetical protein